MRRLRSTIAGRSSMLIRLGIWRRRACRRTLALGLLAAQMSMEYAPTMLVSIDVQIDAFLAYARLMFQAQATSNLLRTPVLK